MAYEEISNNGKSVFLFGSLHSDESKQLEHIRKSIEEFNPDIVLVEGNFDKAIFNSEEDAIKFGREMGFTSFLCKSKNIAIESNDPPISEDKKFIEEKYNNDTKELYFLLRMYSPATTNEEKEQIKRLLKKILSEDFDDSRDYSDYFNPTLSINLLNELTRELNNFRDSFMIQKIKKLLQENKKVFVIKGDHHLKTNIEKIREIVNGS